MVKEITAYQAEDGSVHSSQLGALEADAMMKLGKMDSFNHGTRAAMVRNCQEIVDALAPLAIWKGQNEPDEALPASTLVEPPQSETI